MSFTHFIEHYRAILVGIAFVTIFLWEQVFPQRRFQYLFQHNLINFAYGFLNLFITFAGGYFFSNYLDYFQPYHIFWNIHTETWVRLLVAFLIADALMYWWHRFNHTFPFLWNFHSFHHEDGMMNSTTAIRFHFVELIFSYIFRMIFYPLFGISSTALLVFSTVHFIMIIFHHSNVYMSPRFDRIIRYVITTPGMHRIHHSNRWVETNSNYTSILSLWDFVFRSYKKEPVNEITFGIPKGQP